MEGYFDLKQNFLYKWVHNDVLFLQWFFWEEKIYEYALEALKNTLKIESHV